MDINCDMGESYGHFKIGQDEALFPYISSCSIACGFHGGDPLTIQKTIQSALKHNIRIGAHPSYPDLVGFGRRNMHLSYEELKSNMLYQISALKGMVESLGGTLAYVKPHGALYNKMAFNKSEAIPVLEAIQQFDSNLALMGLASSPLEKWSAEKSIPFIAEAFADRRYHSDGRLLSRSTPNAVISNVTEVVQQVHQLLKKKPIETSNGDITIHAQSICIHGDNPMALEILKALKNTVL